MLLQIFAVKYFEKSNKENKRASCFSPWIIRQEAEAEGILILSRFLHSELIFHQLRACVPNYQRAFGLISTAGRIMDLYVT